MKHSVLGSDLGLLVIVVIVDCAVPIKRVQRHHVTFFLDLHALVTAPANHHGSNQQSSQCRDAKRNASSCSCAHGTLGRPLFVIRASALTKEKITF